MVDVIFPRANQEVLIQKAGKLPRAERIAAEDIRNKGMSAASGDKSTNIGRVSPGDSRKIIWYFCPEK